MKAISGCAKTSAQVTWGGFPPPHRTLFSDTEAVPSEDQVPEKHDRGMFML